MNFFDEKEEYENNILGINETGTIIKYSHITEMAYKLKNIENNKNLVLFLTSNTIGSLQGYLSFMRVGFVPMLLPENIKEDFFKSLLKKYKPKFLYMPQKVAFYIGGYINILKNQDYVLYKAIDFIDAEINPDLALLITTSGSTGSPKFVRQSYENLNSNARCIAQYLELTEEESPITTMPMNYTYGLSIINSHVQVGAKILLNNYNFFYKEFWQFFNKYKVTSLSGVPYTFEILDKINFFQKNYPCLTTITQAGGKLSDELHKKIADYALNNGVKFFVMYGQTEASPRMAYLPYKYAVKKIGSIGIPIAEGSFKLRDVDGTFIKNSKKIGELIYQGPNVALGYAESAADLSKGDEFKGTLATGDIGWCDDEGFYYITGRLKRFLKLFGNRINLDELQALVKKKFVGIECAAVGTDNKVCICVEGKCNKKEEIIKYVEDVIGLHKSVIKIYELNVIKKTSSGKIDYNFLNNIVKI